MKLYYMPGTCSLAPMIALAEAGIEATLVKVGRDKKTADGRDYLAINPYGYVPALELDDGRVLTEGPAILQYLADLWPASGLAPANGSFERYQLQAALAFVGTEVHKSIGALFNPALGEEGKQAMLARALARLAVLEQQLGDQAFLLGERFTVADAYLHVVLGWLAIFKVDLGQWPRLAAYQARIAARPAVQAARATEQGGTAAG